MGLAAVLDQNDKPVGIFTDGDLRRIFDRGGYIPGTNVCEVMHTGPQIIVANRLAVEAVELMEARKVNALLVVDDTGRLVGALNMHDLLKAKVI